MQCDPFGCSFLRRMLDVLKCPYVSHSGWKYTWHICLNHSFRSDLLWRRIFAEQWNKVAIAMPHNADHVHTLASDAPGMWGCGALGRLCVVLSAVGQSLPTLSDHIKVTDPNCNCISSVGQVVVWSHSPLPVQ